MSESTSNPKFRDMRLRVINCAPCPINKPYSGPQYFQGTIHIEDGRATGSWPYGTLFILEEKGQLYATFGDLTIPVSQEEALELKELAQA